MRRPQDDYTFFVYILSNRSHTLYTGVTNGLIKRVSQHRELKPGTFTARYKITRLVYYERYQYIDNAIARETELKHWTRAQKIALIESANPTWEELLPGDELLSWPSPPKVALWSGPREATATTKANADSLRE